jgi:hypothetical protein
VPALYSAEVERLLACAKVLAAGRAVCLFMARAVEPRAEACRRFEANGPGDEKVCECCRYFRRPDWLS